MTKVFLLAVYILSAIAGDALIVSDKPGYEPYLAARQMQVNHRIVDDDIAYAEPPHRFLTPVTEDRSAFIGRYVKVTVPAKRPITIEDTRPGPVFADLKPHDSVVWVPLRNLPPAEVSAMDVGESLDVCNPEGKQRCAHLSLKAIACPTTDPAAAEPSGCSGAFEVTPDERTQILTAQDRTAGPAVFETPKTTVGPATDFHKSNEHAHLTHSPERPSPTPVPSQQSLRVLNTRPGAAP